MAKTNGSFCRFNGNLFKPIYFQDNNCDNENERGNLFEMTVQHFRGKVARKKNNKKQIFQFCLSMHSNLLLIAKPQTASFTHTGHSLDDFVIFW